MEMQNGGQFCDNVTQNERSVTTRVSQTASLSSTLQMDRYTRTCQTVVSSVVLESAAPCYCGGGGPS